MEFSFEQRYANDVDDVVDAYSDPTMYEALPELPRIGAPSTVGCERAGDLVRLDLRYRFTAGLPAAARAVLDPGQLTWVQRTTFHLSARRAEIVLVPDHYADRLTCSAEFVFVADDAGARRRVEGDLSVRAPVVAGQVERAILSGLEEYLTAEAPAVDAWISTLV